MATGAPGTNGVWQYGEDDSEATFSALLNKAASTTDTQLGLDRARLTTLEARKLSGLVPVVPSSVDKSGGTATAGTNGTVTFGGVSSLSLNGVFTTSFTNYVIMWDLLGTADMVPNVKMRASGTDTTNNYWASRFYQIDASIGGQNNGSNAAWGISPNAVKKYFGEMTLFNPKATANTYMHQSSYLLTSDASAASMAQQQAHGAYLSTTSFDGFTIFPSSGTIAGTIRVFGYVA